jgi:hypothetical protein
MTIQIIKKTGTKVFENASRVTYETGIMYQNTFKDGDHLVNCLKKFASHGLLVTHKYIS